MTTKLTWPQALNHLATGMAIEVKYYTGVLASYRFVDGKVATFYEGKFHSYREPCNPQYGFRITRS